MIYDLDVSKLGLVRGMVTNTNDPLKLCRVQVRVPMIHGVQGSTNFRPDAELPWAYPCLPANMKQVPKVTDFVWITFENNDVRMPVYLGIVLGKQSPNPANPSIYGSESSNRDVAPSNYEAPYNGNEEGTIFESVGGFSLRYSDIDGTVILDKDDMEVKATADDITLSVGNSLVKLTAEGIETNFGNGTIKSEETGVSFSFGDNSIRLEGGSIVLTVGGSTFTLTGNNISLGTGSSSIVMTGSSMTLQSPVIHENP